MNARFWDADGNTVRVTADNPLPVTMAGGGAGGGMEPEDITATAPATWDPETATIGVTLGTTASTAKAGDYVPAYGEITGKPSTFPATLAGTGSQTTAAHSDHTHTALTATQVTATAIAPGTATTAQGILGELAERLALAEAAIVALQTA